MSIKYNKNKVYFLIFWVVFCVGCADQSCLKNTSGEWYQLTKKYIHYDDLIFQNEIKDAERGIRLLQSREKAKKSLIETEKPTKQVLACLLDSPKTLDKKIALVNIMLRGGYSTELYELIFVVLKNSSDIPLRFYSYKSLANLDKEGIAKFEKDFFTSLANENSKANILIAIPILSKIESPNVIDHFVKYLTSDSESIQLTARKYLSNLNKEYQKEIQKQIKNK